MVLAFPYNFWVSLTKFHVFLLKCWVFPALNIGFAGVGGSEQRLLRTWCSCFPFLTTETKLFRASNRGLWHLSKFMPNLDRISWKRTKQEMFLLCPPSVSSCYMLAWGGWGGRASGFWSIFGFQFSGDSLKSHKTCLKPPGVEWPASLNAVEVLKEFLLSTGSKASPVSSEIWTAFIASARD